MALEVFKLVGSIFVDNSAANESIAKTDEKAKGVGDTLLNGVAKAAEWGAAIAAAAVAAGTAIYNLGMDTAEAADEIDKGSIRMGISTDYYQQLQYAAGQCGVSMSDLEKAAKKLEGTDLTMDEALASIMELETAEERAAAASDLFGDSVAYTLSPLIEQSGESFDGLLDRANELGLVMSEDAVSAGVTLRDTISDVKQSFEGMKNSLGTALIPLIQQAADFILSNLPTIQGVVSQLIPVVSQLGQSLLPPLMQLVSSILPLIVSLFTSILPIVTTIMDAVLPVIISLMETLLPPFIQIVEALLPPLLQLLEPLLTLLQPIIDLLNPILSLVTSILTPIGALIGTLLQPLINLIVSLISTGLNVLQPILVSVSNTLSGAFAGAITLVTNIVTSLKSTFNSITTFLTNVFTGNWSAAWASISGIVTGVWNGISNAVKSGINWIISGINSFIRGINSISIPSWVPLVGGKSFNISLLPTLAEGGILEKGQVGFLEGNGAEAVVPLENNSKWISKVAEDMNGAIGGGDQVVGLLSDILDAIESIADSGVYIDKDKLVGAIAPAMNKRLGRISAQEARA